MKIIFLNRGFVDSLTAYGVEIKKAPEWNSITEVLGYSNFSVARDQTDALLGTNVFRDIPLKIQTKYLLFDSEGEPLTESKVPYNEKQPNTIVVDLAILDGAGLGRGQRRELNALNCVVTSDEILILYMDEDNASETPVPEKLVLALGKVMDTAAILETDLWKYFEKTSNAS